MEHQIWEPAAPATHEKRLILLPNTSKPALLVLANPCTRLGAASCAAFFFSKVYLSGRRAAVQAQAVGCR